MVQVYDRVEQFYKVGTGFFSHDVLLRSDYLGKDLVIKTDDKIDRIIFNGKEINLK